MNQDMSLAEFEAFVPGQNVQTFVYNSRDQIYSAAVPEFQYCFDCVYVDMMRGLVMLSRKDDVSRLAFKGIKSVKIEYGDIADVYTFCGDAALHRVLIKR